MKDEEYELVPREEIEELKHELEKLKKNPYSDSEKNRNLLDSMDNLTIAINKLVKIFEKAQEEILRDYQKNKPTVMLNEILDQNTKIAKGTLAVADMIKQQQKDITDLKTKLTTDPTKNIPNFNSINNSQNTKSDNQINFVPNNSQNSTTSTIDNKIPNMKNPFNLK